MDGNGRWAQAHGVPRKAGHRQGVEAVRQLVRSIEGLGLEYLTLYGFSSENWNRPEKEVNDLMGLLRSYIRQEFETNSSIMEFVCRLLESGPISMRIWLIL